MGTQANSRPTRPTIPVIRHTSLASAGPSPNLLRLLPAAIVSAVVHVGLFGLLLLVTSPETKGNSHIEKPAPDDDKNTTQQQPPPKPPEEEPPPPEDTVKEVDDDAKDADIEIQYNNKRVEEKSAPGDVNPNDPVGVETGRDDPVTSIAAPSGIGGKGVGGAIEGPGDATGININPGGYGLGGKMAGSFYGRSGATKKEALREGGGTEASEAAVNQGLDWIWKHQAPDGHWSLDGFHRHGHCNCRNRSQHNNDIAATAFGLLPMLGYGYTHKRSKDTPDKYRIAVLKGLDYLMRKQIRTTGDFGGGMYSHGLATIAICEAYGLTQDPRLKPHAQAAVNFIVRAQHEEGGWRYSPRQPGDISVVGWQVMALKSAQMANLSVPARTLKGAIDFLDRVMVEVDSDYGYGYMKRGESTETRTSIGLLCRLYLQNLGPATKIMSKGVANWLVRSKPVNAKNMYYYYYATQVLHHLNNKDWKEWNGMMRNALIREQITAKNVEERYKHELGSWSPEGDPHGGVGGRLMITSLSILTLEVYYRHLPLYKRESVLDKKDLAAK